MSDGQNSGSERSWTVSKTIGMKSEQIAVEALDKLRNGEVGTNDNDSHGKGERLLDKMKQSAVELYEQTRSNHPTLIRRADQFVKKLEETSGMWRASSSLGGVIGSKREAEDGNEENLNGVDIRHIRDQGIEGDGATRERVSKRRRIKENLKEYKLNMSIESKKRLMTCLGLLKLANKQLSQRVMSLQDVVKKEQVIRASRRKQLANRSSPPKPLPQERGTTSAEEKSNGEAIKSAGNEENEDDNECFYDASSIIQDPKEDKGRSVGDEEKIDGEDEEEEEEEEEDATATEIQLEVVGTLKKVYSVVSRFTGNSLPEPARSQVRETLLKLPTKWMVKSDKSYSGKISSNGRALLLAQESLEMVSNVMNVVDNTLDKVEEWVKNKQELKQTLMEKFKHEQLKQQVKTQLAKESESST